MARILVAEDEEALRSLVVRALRQDGHEVMTANDGAEALDVLTRDVRTSNRRRELDGRSGSLNDGLYAVPWVRHSASLHEMLAFEQGHIPSHRRRIP